MNIRQRRLKRDYEKVIEEMGGSAYVKVSVVSGDPPDHYCVTYRLAGLTWDGSSNTAQPISEHVVDIFLPVNYPKQAPRCVMRTPIWHPNIGDYVCIGDYWSAGVTLVDIIAHIGDMIQYKSYNLKSPVNKSAALWAQRNERSFPVGNLTIISPKNDDVSETVTVNITRDDDTDLGISLGPIRNIKL